ncbi:MAG TPA: SCO family protein [Povalibacter sp.]|uniref:SCO family protein n=1 Tax=Povalibacter sp. TaxID=1962978 RepID=UPI002CCD578C|nr:SCO family protein [Povalibacter sp.]HMN43876.1 SCO family protein [Povalibacter sp.]
MTSRPTTTRRNFQHPKGRRAVLGLLCAIGLATLSASAGAAAPALKAGVFDPPRVAPDFSLQGSGGAPLKLSDYRGRVVLLGFGFTSCPDVCPTTLSVLAAARKKLGAAASDAQVIYLTVDPERDTAARMKQYLGTFDPTFVGGTGTVDQMAAVRKDYGIQAEKKVFGNNYMVAHSSYVYLIDRKGALRALMPYGHTPDDYVHDLRVLLSE